MILSAEVPVLYAFTTSSVSSALASSQKTIIHLKPFKAVSTVSKHLLRYEAQLCDVVNTCIPELRSIVPFVPEACVRDHLIMREFFEPLVVEAFSNPGKFDHYFIRHISYYGYLQFSSLDFQTAGTRR